MPAHKVKLEIDQGATFDKTFTWMTGTDKANAAPVDLTGCKARAQFREELESDVVLIGLSTENGRIVLGGVEGTIRLFISAADTAAMNWQSAVYDLEIEFPNGTVIRRMAGSVVVSPEVTRGLVIDVPGRFVDDGAGVPLLGD
ncbi:hypothetical protein P245_14400 [Comamonas thiooxydans]|uniref:Uncharacterized protein n=1 Tax=Comamonas thiooxydans TaxID=363952 RepID=A0A0E3C1F4_9BURK|nr:hypothetical protein [Comamonas thiooxydans]KGG90958.1 hypothetical protein P245_14400 [Comamonas thiooxydans]